jgi:hypothetical protein
VNMDQLVTGPVGASIPDPPQLISPMSPAVMLAFFGLTAVAALALAVYWSVIRRDALPVFCCVGAVLCALNEPIFDVLGKIVYAENNVMAYSAFGRQIPVFLVIGYIAWVGLLPYVIARGMAAGWSRTQLYGVSVAGVASVCVTELVNVFVHGWEYYGEAPLKFFGGVAAMASVPLAAGFLLYSLAFPATGWRRLLAGLVIPIFALPMMFAATGWPLYLALYTPLPPLLDYVAILVMCGLIVLAVIGTVRLTEFWRRSAVLLTRESAGSNRSASDGPQRSTVRVDGR